MMRDMISCLFKATTLVLYRCICASTCECHSWIYQSLIFDGREPLMRSKGDVIVRDRAQSTFSNTYDNIQKVKQYL
jgi:hypothetical protein